MAKKYVFTHVYDTEDEAKAAQALLMGKFSSSLENLSIIPRPFGFILQINTNDIADETIKQIKAEIDPHSVQEINREPEITAPPAAADHGLKRAEKEPDWPKSAGTAEPVRPTQKAPRPGISRGKLAGFSLFTSLVIVIVILFTTGVIPGLFSRASNKPGNAIVTTLNTASSVTQTPTTGAFTSPLQWKFSTGQPITYRPPSRVALSADGSLMITASNDNNICVLDKRGNLAWEYATGDIVNSVATNKDGSLIAGASGDGMIYLLDQNGMLVWKYNIGGSDICVAMSADGSFVAAGSYDNDSIFLFDRNGNLLWKYTTDYNRIWSIALSADGSFVVAGDYGGNIYLLSQKGNLIWENDDASNWVDGVAISADGSLIAAATEDGTIYLLDQNGTLIWEYTNSGSNRCVALSADGSYLAAGADDRHVCVLDKSGKLSAKYDIDGTANGVALSSDGSFIAASSRNGNAYLFMRSSHTAVSTTSTPSRTSSTTATKTTTTVNSTPAVAARWNFEGNLQDSSGNNNNGTANGNITYGSSFNQASGQALVLAGNGYYARAQNTSSLNISGPITVEAWVYVNAFTSNSFYTIVGKWDDQSGNDRGYLLGLWAGDGKLQPRFYISSDGSDNSYVNSSIFLNIKTWYKITGTFDGRYLKIYVSSPDQPYVLAGSDDLGSTQSIYINNKSLVFGANLAGGASAGFLNGKIDNVTIYNGILPIQASLPTTSTTTTTPVTTTSAITTTTSTTTSTTITTQATAGTLNVYSDQIGASIYVGTQLVGTTGAGSNYVNGLFPGTYILKHTDSGYKDWSGQITIVANQTASVTVTLTQ